MNIDAVRDFLAAREQLRAFPAVPLADAARHYAELLADRERSWTVDEAAKLFELRAHLPPPEQRLAAGARVGMVCVGTSRYAMEESRDQLAREAGIEASWMRLTAYPFPPELEAFLEQHERVYVIDQNRDAQLLGLMRLELPARLLGRLRSVRYYGGLPLDARTVTQSVLEQEAHET